MDTQPLVSVIVPTFNGAAFIGETLRSIIAQTYHNLDIIVIDDCSSDDTVKVVGSFDDARIRILRNEVNSGAAYSRNRGIAESKGEYIAFLDGDDIWSADKIERQLTFMAEHDYKFSSCYYDFMDEKGNLMNRYMSSPGRMTHRTFLRTDHVGCLTVMYKKDVCPDLQIPETIYKRNDYALWIKLSEKADCYALPVVLATHRKRSGSISSVSKLSLVRYHKVMFEKLYGFGKAKSSFYAWRNALYYLIRKVFYTKRMRNGAAI